MDGILKGLGQNRVTLPLKTNGYEEKHMRFASPPYDALFNPIEFMRIKPPAQATPQVQGIDSLYGAVAILLDPTMALFKDKTLVEKIRVFKEGVIKTYDFKLKELGLTKSKITQDGLVSDDAQAAKYLARLFKKSFLVESEGDGSVSLYKGTEDGPEPVYDIKKSCDKYSLSEKTYTLKDCYARLCDGIENKLVKDIRDIAGIVGVDKQKDGKLLSKKALIDEIVKSIS